MSDNLNERRVHITYLGIGIGIVILRRLAATHVGKPKWLVFTMVKQEEVVTGIAKCGYMCPH